MSENRVVVFIGPQGVGKTHVGELVAHALGGHRFSFADPIRMMMYGLIGDQFWEIKDKSQPQKLLGGKSIRHAMQTLGTEWGRECIHPDIWVRMMEGRLEQQLKDTSVVIDDARFPNEFESLVQFRPWTVKLHRSDIPVQFDQHESEAYWRLQRTNAEVDNNGTIEDTVAAVLLSMEATA